MANLIRNATGCISVTENNGKLTSAIIGKYRELKLNETEIATLYEAYKEALYNFRASTEPMKAIEASKAAETALNDIIDARANNKGSKDAPSDEAIHTAAIKKALGNLINFFTEFQFTPSFRFTNTLCNLCKKSNADAISYIGNYFKLMDSPYAQEVIDKMKAPEFRKNILTLLADNVTPTKLINNRLRIYYGAQGTGKTTEAMKQTQTVVVCNSAMQPCDLIEDFTFDDGKATFHPSALVKAMEAGETVLLDEMNLLPFDSLRFLQGICDGKESFEWKGNTIHIHTGFNIIGTMNLVVNGTTFGLPEPIVDRCAELREFTLNIDALMGAI